MESKLSNAYDLSLAAFAKENFTQAHDRAMEAAAEEESRLAPLQKEQQAGVDRLVRDYQLAGDAAYNGQKFNKASEAYRRALAHVSKEHQAAQWASLQVNVGNAEDALISRSEGEAVLDHEKLALESFLAASTVFTREQLPQGWATTQNNLGNALGDLADRSEGSQANQYLQQAIEAHRNALQVYTESEFPANWAMALNNMAAAYEHRKDWTSALECYAQLAKHYPTNLQFQAKLKELSEK